jgi:hypothetical protein
MDRAVLLVILGIPILVIIHVALFWQPVPWNGGMLWTASQDTERSQLRGHWQSSEQTLPFQAMPSRFVIEHTAQRGS